MDYQSTYEDHWGNSMIMGIPFVLKNKYASLSEASSNLAINMPTNHGFLYDFTYELEVLKQCEDAELLEKKLLEDAKLEDEKEAKKTKMEDSAQPEPSPPVPQITILEPKKSEAPSVSEIGTATKGSNALVDRSLIEDFEATGPSDDPFVAAELGTINDLEELRDVLASMKTSLNAQVSDQDTMATKNDKFSSLKSLCFPQLSVDESTSAVWGSIPTSSSQPNLFTSSPKTPSFEPLHSTASRSNASATLGKEGIDMDKCFDKIEEDKSEEVAGICMPAALLAQPQSADESYSQKSSNVHVEQLPSVGPPRTNSNCNDRSEEDFDDPPVVSHLTKMGFERTRVLALLDANNKTENEETLISQLCNWAELEEKGFARGVGHAAVLFAPHDLNKAIEFAMMMSELTEMGFPLNATGEALRVSKMNKEAAVLHLLDPNCSSAVPSTSVRDSHRYGYSLDSTPGYLNGRRSKKKDQKKSHVSHSYLHARH